MFGVIITKGELYDKCENIEQLYDRFYYPLLLEYNELKKQLEEQIATNEVLSHELTKDKILKQDYLTTCCGMSIKNVQKLINQQKEFIKYLEDEIQSCEAVSDLLFNSNKEMKAYKQILQKYKEIIGDYKS